MSRITRFGVLALATCGFLTYGIVAWAKAHGRRLTGAGFIGTLAGLLCVRWLPVDPVHGFLVLMGALAISVAVSDAAEEILGQKDDQRIVIDEWVGYLASMFLLRQTPIYLASAFVLFRLIDSTKPAGLDRFGNLPGGWGVVMDDFVGGLVVNLILRGITYCV